jgi:hypothetical protein
MYPVTHLVVHTINRDAAPVLPTAIRPRRGRRRLPHIGLPRLRTA